MHVPGSAVALEKIEPVGTVGAKQILLGSRTA
jgi:hypothetical protein